MGINDTAGINKTVNSTINDTVGINYRGINITVGKMTEWYKLTLWG